jgi:hypothetical protein
MDSAGALLAFALGGGILLRFQVGQFALQLAVVLESVGVERADIKGLADGAVWLVLVTAIAITAAGGQVGDVGECTL